MALLSFEWLRSHELARLRAELGETERLWRAGHGDISRALDSEDSSSDRAALIASALRKADVTRDRADMERAGVRLILHDDQDYPCLLSTIADPPPALWVQGDLEERDGSSVAVIGSRRASPYGIVNAGRISRALSEAGHTVISGAAMGIDAEAHRGVLRSGGRTIAVIGGGLHEPYPPQNRGLMRAIIESGGVVMSESPMRTEPRASVFPRRNRVISGLCVGVVVIEAAEKSGAMITARLAAEEHHREVMALPGPADSPTSAGCHKMIREGWAALVQSGADCLKQLESCGVLLAGAREMARKPALRPQERLVQLAIDELGSGATIDQLCSQVGLAPAQVRVSLTMLAMATRCTATDSSRSSRARRTLP